MDTFNEFVKIIAKLHSLLDVAGDMDKSAMERLWALADAKDAAREMVELVDLLPPETVGEINRLINVDVGSDRVQLGRKIFL
jgi:hypothetical protein